MPNSNHAMFKGELHSCFSAGFRELAPPPPAAVQLFGGPFVGVLPVTLRSLPGWKGAKELGESKFGFEEGAKEPPYQEFWLGTWYCGSF